MEGPPGLSWLARARSLHLEHNNIHRAHKIFKPKKQHPNNPKKHTMASIKTLFMFVFAIVVAVAAAAGEEDQGSSSMLRSREL
jgi:ABC-type transport system involved in multi-copper enzyme maturation permease subunit